MNYRHVKAVIYKNYLLDKKRIPVVIFTLTVPYFAIIMIVFISWITKRIKNNFDDTKKLKIFPDYVYPCNLNHDYNSWTKNFWESSSVKRMFTVAFSDPKSATKELNFDSYFKYLPKHFTVDGTRRWPRFEKFDTNKVAAIKISQSKKSKHQKENYSHSFLETSELINKYIINTLKDLSKENIRHIKYLKDNSLSDAYIVFKNISRVKGISANIQVNSLLDREYHILNGFSLFRTRSLLDIFQGFKTFQQKVKSGKVIDSKKIHKNKITELEHLINPGQVFSSKIFDRKNTPKFFVVNTPTEAFISLINLFSNTILPGMKEARSQSRKYEYYRRSSTDYREQPQVISFVSPTYDSSRVEWHVNSLLELLSILLFPVCLSIGLGLILNKIVIDKKARVNWLLKINGGVKPMDLWIGFYGYHFLVLFLMNIGFLVFGRLVTELQFFVGGGFLLNSTFLLFWTLGFCSFSLFLSSFFSAPSMDNQNFYGEIDSGKISSGVSISSIVSVFVTIVVSVCSFVIFPNPAKFPLFFYIVPQACLARYVYSMTTSCLDYECIQSFNDLMRPNSNFQTYSDVRASFLAMVLTSLGYCVLGIALNEQRIQSYYHRYFKICAEFTKSNFLILFEKLKSLTLDRPDITRTREKTARGYEKNNLRNNKIMFDEEELNFKKSNDTTNSSDISFCSSLEQGSIELTQIDPSDEIDNLSFCSDMSLLSEISKSSYRQRLLNRDYVLVANNLKKYFRKRSSYNTFVKAVDDVSLELEKNKIFALLGPNGAGKTTLMSLLTNLMVKDSGEILLQKDQQETLKSDDEGRLPNLEKIYRTDFGICPQYDIYWPSLSVEEHLEIFRMLESPEFSRINGILAYQSNLIKVLELDPFKHQRADRLSGGTKRRLSLLLALIRNPKILFLDEPSTSLDPKKRYEFWTMLGNLKKQTTIFVTTHLMNEIDNIADKISFIVKGRIVCEGSPRMIKKQYLRTLKIEVVVKNKKLKEFSKKEQLKMARLIMKRRMDDNIHIRDLMVLQLVDKLKNLGINFVYRKFGVRKYFIKVRKSQVVKVMGRVFEILMRDTNIESWAIRKGSIEDVFLKVIEKEGRNRDDGRSNSRLSSKTEIDFT